MENMAKTSILLMVALLIATVVSTGSVIAQQTCPPEDCTVFAKKDTFSLAILPDTNNQWPIVVSTPPVGDPDSWDFRCDDPGSPTPANYPCLAWPYQCIGDDCNNIGAIWAMIPTCCDKPIEVLWTSRGSPADWLTTCEDNDHPQTECDSIGLRLTPVAGGPGPLFWFSTPKDVGINAFDIITKVGVEILPCKVAIGGPGCNTPIPPVRVEPRVQCFQFIAETNNGPKVQTWYAEWAGTDPCAVDVWAATEINGTPVLCENVKEDGEKLIGKELGDITITIEGDDQALTEAITNNSQCNEGWLRFTDANGTNIRCYYSGGRRYCY